MDGALGGGGSRLVRGVAAIAAFVVCLITATAAGATATPLGALVPAQTGETLGPAAVIGGNVFVGAPDTTLTVQAQGAIFVYAEPAAGWSGSRTETAVLTASHAQAGDGLVRPW